MAGTRRSIRTGPAAPYAASTPSLTRRRHIDLARLSSAACRH